MPLYDYHCAGCGGFSDLRPMAQSADPADCPSCGAAAPRVLVSSPMLATMDAGQRLAHGRNERSAHEPRHSSERARHPANCGCCAPRAKRKAEPAGLKSFPAARPWMISH
jgi:putative FmdB family regulatory protein